MARDPGFGLRRDAPRSGGRRRMAFERSSDRLDLLRRDYVNGVAGVGGSKLAEVVGLGTENGHDFNNRL